jgi:hypothetical protein
MTHNSSPLTLHPSHNSRILLIGKNGQVGWKLQSAQVPCQHGVARMLHETQRWQGMELAGLTPRANWNAPLGYKPATPMSAGRGI